MEQISGRADVSPVKRKLAGVGSLALGLGLAYVTMFRPLVEAQRTGELHYYMKGILLPPVCIALGLLLLTTTLTDDDLRTTNAKGKRTFSRSGWIFFACMIALTAATFAGWWFCLRSFGFEMFS